jgi:hypothetical protein
LESNKKEEDWNELSQNPNAISLLQRNQKIINRDDLAGNPNAIDFIYTNKIRTQGWSWLAANPNAIHILEYTDRGKAKLMRLMRLRRTCEEIICGAD